MTFLKKIHIFIISCLFWSALAINNTFAIAEESGDASQQSDTEIENSLYEEEEEEEEDDDEDEEDKYVFSKNSNFAFVLNASANMTFIDKKVSFTGLSAGVGFTIAHKISTKAGIFITPSINFLIYNLSKNNKVQDNYESKNLVYTETTGDKNTVTLKFPSEGEEDTKNLNKITILDKTEDYKTNTNYKSAIDGIPNTVPTYYIKGANLSSRVNFMALGETRIGLSLNRFDPYLKISLGALFSKNEASFFNSTAKDISSLDAYKENYNSISSLLTSTTGPATGKKYGLDIIETKTTSIVKNKTSLVAGAGVGLSFHITKYASIYAEYSFYISSFHITFDNVPNSFIEFATNSDSKIIEKSFSHKIHTISVGLNFEFSL